MSPLSDRAVRHLQDALGEPGLAADRYELAECIGEGGMGTVFRAYDRRLERFVALKVLHHAEYRPEVEERMWREARILARLEHPGIVPIHDVGQLPDGRVFYAMKLVLGERLDGYARGPATIPDRLRLFLRICEPVSFAHAQGVIHRDLKPENIMVGPFGEVLVLDWGVAKLRDAAGGAPIPTRDPHQTSDGAIIGTPHYMPPEQASGAAAQADARSDVFALGRILAELTSNASRPLMSITARATAADPSQRYPEVASLAADVRQLLDHEPVSAHRESWAERLSRLYTRHQTVVVLVLAYLLMRTLLFLWKSA